MNEFDRLVEIVARLRAPGGCPWDREQTIDSLKPFVLEETYEVVEAIDRHDYTALREELGDFLFEAVFLAQLEADAGHFTLADSLTCIADKLVRRHPHVFDRDGRPPVTTAGEVVKRWEEIKAEERGGHAVQKTLLGGIPRALPALLRAYQIGLRAASVGFDWSRPPDVVDKMREEVEEIREAVAERAAAHDGGNETIEEELGDLLFAVASLARQLGVEPEAALRKANDKFTTRFEQMERTIRQSGRLMKEMSLEDLEREWQKIKEAMPAS